MFQNELGRLWDKPEVPKTGWVLRRIDSRPANDGTCTMCGRTGLQAVYVMIHSKFSRLAVCLGCAVRMDENPQRAEAREVLRNGWLSGPWETAQTGYSTGPWRRPTGNPMRTLGDYNVGVHRHKDGWSWRIRRLSGWPRFAKQTYATEEEAKLALFDAYWELLGTTAKPTEQLAILPLDVPSDVQPLDLRPALAPCSLIDYAARMDIEQLYRNWVASPDASGTRLNLTESEGVGGVGTLDRSTRVFQVYGTDNTFAGLVVAQGVAIPAAAWNTVHGRADTIELVNLLTGVCLRMYLEHILQVGKPAAINGAPVVLVPMMFWTVYDRGGRIVQGGHLQTVAGPPPAIVSVGYAAETDGIVRESSVRGARTPAEAIRAAPRHLTSGKCEALLLHPKGWKDEYIESLRVKLRAHLDRVSPDVIVVTARAAWEVFSQPRKGKAWGSYAAYAANVYPVHIVPLVSELDPYIGSITADIVSSLLAEGKPPIGWRLDSDTLVSVTSVVQIGKNRQNGWKVATTP